MELMSRVGYTEELPMHRLADKEYLDAAQKAVAFLRWDLIALGDGSLVFNTKDNDFLATEQIAITVKDKTATWHSIPVNEYYRDEQKSRANIDAYQQAILHVIEEQEKANRNLHPMHREKYGALVPSKSYIVTPLIVYANVLVFIAMICAGLSPLHPTAQSLFLWGGNFKPAVMHGEWWRLISYMFLHGGAMHLLMNTYALLYIGMFLEPLLGRARFVSAYLFTGVCAGLMSIAMHPASVGVGASGAIFGMYGVFLSMLTTSHIQKTMRKTMLRSILFFVVYNLLAGLQGNTDNAAHIGGLLSGIVIGYVYYYGISKRASLNKQLATIAICALCTVLLAMFTLARI